MTRKCPSCNVGTVQERVHQKIVLHFSNPGDVIFEGRAECCNKCNFKLIAADDLETAAAFEKAYEEQYLKNHQ